METNEVAQAHAATEDPTTTLVLLRIKCLFEDAVRHGLSNIPLSHNDLMAETGCTYSQVERATSILRKRELVAVQQMKFGYGYINHYQLTRKGWEVFHDSKPYPIFEEGFTKGHALIGGKMPSSNVAGLPATGRECPAQEEEA